MKKDYEILYEDRHIIVCFKPHGLAVQSRKPGTPDLEHLLLNHIAKQTSRKPGHTRGRPYLAVIHRLDQPVSGLLVFAKTAQAAQRLNAQLHSENFGKHYLAWVDGIPDTQEGTRVDYLVKDGRTNTSRVCDPDTPGAKLARLSYRVRETGDGQALLEITLDTGRHHQIRVQLAHMGCPIIGDTKYNPNALNARGWQTLKLCAHKLTFRHPISQEPMEFESKKP